MMVEIKKALATLVCLWSLIFSVHCHAAQQDIVILYTNDIHCAIEDNEGMARLAQYKKELQAMGKHVALVDAGDAIQGAPLGKLSNGAAVVNVMNSVGYDFAIPGNHEFDYGMEIFKQRAAELSCGYYSANLMAADSGELLLPTHKVLQFEDTKVAFIGVTTPETLSSTRPKYFKDAAGNYLYSFCEDASGTKLYAQLQKVVDAVRPQVDYVILVAHLGVEGSRPQWSSEAVAANVAGVDVIIDAHSHEVNPATLAIGKDDKHVIITQTGSKLQNIGQLTITPEGKLSTKLISGLTEQEPATLEVIAQEKAKFAELLQLPVGETTVPLYTTNPETGERTVRSSETNLGDLVADALREVTGADVAIVNGGAIRGGLSQGLITYNDLLQVLPFENGCVVKVVTGQQLLDALEVGARLLPEENGGFLQVSGMTYTVDASVPSGVVLDEKGSFIEVEGAYRVQDVTVGGKPLDLMKEYTLASNAYLLLDGGNGMTMFKDCRVLQDDNLSDLDAVIEYVQNHLGAVVGAEYAAPVGRIIVNSL